jgi:F-type H+-transporting ATPase subunit b
MFSNPTFWVAVSFVLFFLLVWKAGAFKTMLLSLDARGEKIAADLAEAKRLRTEAEAILADYEAKRRAAEKEAKAIVKAAKEDAERLLHEAETKLNDFVVRRTAAAEEKIAQAELSAAAEVRLAAGEAALKASQYILQQTLTGKAQDAFLSESIKDVARHLNS